MSENFYSYAFRLTSHLSYVELPRKLNNVRKLKVKSLKYITKTLNNEYLLISISGWTDNASFFAGYNQHKEYTKYLPLNGTVETQNVYLNNNVTDFDVIKTNSVANVGNLQIEITIDGTYNNDISPSNPILLELYISD